jgi:hypothetical protein
MHGKVPSLRLLSSFELQRCHVRSSGASTVPVFQVQDDVDDLTISRDDILMIDDGLMSIGYFVVLGKVPVGLHKKCNISSYSSKIDCGDRLPSIHQPLQASDEQTHSASRSVR